MIGYIVVGAAAAVDGFAAGVYVGRKFFATKSPDAVVQAEGAAVEHKLAPVVAAMQADAPKVEAVATDVLAEAKALEAKLAAHVAAIKTP